MKSKIMVLVLAVMVLMAGNVFACGPFFDEAYLVRGSEQEFLSMPEGDFQYELEKISGNTKKPQPKEKPEYDAIKTKTADVAVCTFKSYDKNERKRSSNFSSLVSIGRFVNTS